jgi:hypothetical protein
VLPAEWGVRRCRREDFHLFETTAAALGWEAESAPDTLHFTSWLSYLYMPSLSPLLQPLEAATPLWNRFNAITTKERPPVAVFRC